MRLAVAAALGLLPLLAGRVALAQTARGAAAAPSAAPADWEAQYAAAGREMLDGHFDEAIVEYTDLARTAPTPVARDAALGQLGIASDHAGGKRARTASVTEEASPQLPPPPRQPATDRRTVDEIVFLYVVGAQGYGVVSAALAAALSSDGGSALLGLGAAGASAGLIAVADLHGAFHYGSAEAVTTGFLIGTGVGLGFGIWDGNHIFGTTSYGGSYEYWTSAEHADRRAAAWTFTLSTAGIVGGVIAGALVRTTPGRSAWVAATSLSTGIVAAGIAGGATANRDYTDRDSLSSFALAGAIGALGGTAVGILTAPVVSPRISRVRYIDLAWLSSGLLALGACTSCKTQERFGALAGATAGGFLLGTVMTLGIKREPLPTFAEKGAAQVSMLPYAAPTAGGMEVGVGGDF